MRQTRVTFTSCGGDAIVMLLCFWFFEHIWQDEVDKYYICYNAKIDDKVVKFLEKRIANNPKVEWIYFDHGIGNGPPITECLKHCKEDLIMLLEDDGYIFKKGIVDKCFKRIEDGEVDAVGSPRGSCGNEIWEASGKKYNEEYTAYGDVGPNYWPNFLFLKRADLEKTDKDFGSKRWEVGEYSPELDHTFKEANCGDTFVWACVQLRAMGVRFGKVPQWKAAPFEPYLKEAKQGYWIEEPFGWIHAGSLSSGWNGLLAGQYQPDQIDESAKREIETRVAFWTIASDLEPYEEIKEFKENYKQGIENLIRHYQLDREKISEKISLYKNLMGL